MDSRFRAASLNLKRSHESHPVAAEHPHGSHSRVMSDMVLSYVCAGGALVGSRAADCNSDWRLLLCPINSGEQTIICTVQYTNVQYLVVFVDGTGYVKATKQS